MIIKATAQAIPLADNSVQCVVTSPPYWGLRSYAIEPVVWGGDKSCQHEWGTAIPLVIASGLHRMPPNQTGGTKEFEQSRGDDRGCWCRSCGAWRGHLGLEPTPELYVSHMVGVFREVRRALREDGTLWLNVGDCFNSGTSAKRKAPKTGVDVGGWNDAEIDTGARVDFPGLKVKDLCGLPWRVAFALQADGWWLRSDIIWAKPNPMPESVTDRPTRSHEYVFLLTKSARYFYDQDAIREPHGPGSVARVGRGRSDQHKWSDGGPGDQTLAKDISAACHPNGRNKRSVWTIPTEGFPGAHFATFPQKLVEPCILAGSRAGDLVLDPFLGSGTVGRVAESLGRRWVGLDLGYHGLSKERVKVTTGLPFGSAAVGE